MPIRDFQFFKTLKNTFAKKPLKLLTNERLIIDGSWFVKKYNVSNNLSPFTSLLEKLKDTEIIWIWNGIKPKRIFYTDFAGATLAEVEKKNYKAANKHYTKFSECYDIKTKNYINAQLQKHNVKCITAPYVAMAQAIYIQQNLSCYFFGPTDYLLFEGAEKLVTDFYFESDQIEIVYKNEICRALKLNANKFQELALLFGSEFCPTIPPFSINFSGQKVVEMFSYMPIVDAIRKRQDVDDEYVKKYVNTLHYLKFCPVMTVNGVQLLSDYSPRVFYGSKVSLDEIFGKRLREDFYQKMFLCEICPDILEVFVHAENRENNEYVNLSSDLLNSICKYSTEKENSVIGSIDKLSIKSKTVEEYMKETFKLDVSFIDTFPVHEQVVIGRYLNDIKTQKILDSVISAYLNPNLDLSTLDKNVLYYYLNFTKDIKFCSELVCLLRSFLNLQHKECVFDYKNYKPLLIQFLKANNRNNVCDSLVQKMNG